MFNWWNEWDQTQWSHFTRWLIKVADKTAKWKKLPFTINLLITWHHMRRRYWSVIEQHSNSWSLLTHSAHMQSLLLRLIRCVFSAVVSCVCVSLTLTLDSTLVLGVLMRKSMRPCLLKHDRHKSQQLDIRGDGHFYPSGTKYDSVCVWLISSLWLIEHVCEPVCSSCCVREKIWAVLSVSLRHVEWCTANLRAISHLSLRPECLVGREPQDGWAACYCSVIDFAGLLALLPRSTSHD